MEFKSGQPIYLQIARHICREILQGVYQEQDRLPSVRDYAAAMEVNVNTLVRTYGWLAQHQIVYNRCGLGYFVSKGAAAHIMQARRREFFTQWIPDLVERMRDLDITPEQVMQHIRQQPEQ